jgi:hypothetical protein
MKRRTLLYAAAGAGASSMAAAPAARRAIFELRYFQLRNNPDNMSQRISDILKDSYLPAAKRAGAGAMGFFGNLISPNGPFLLALTSYPSLAAYEAALETLAADESFAKAVSASNSLPGLGYVRMEVSLLRAFSGMPDIAVPPTTEKRPARVFELRVYESNNLTTLRRKIQMFNDGEIAIFRKTGLLPVFFGETIVGRNMPNLTYLLAFDDLAAREKNWRTFVSDPDWVKLRATPGWSDPEIVSNISNMMLRPLPFSPIR